MNNSLAVSIIIPTYNRNKLLLETLYSVKNQTLKNWECIIVDDGSSDNTEEEVNNFILDDIRFQFVKRPVNYPKGACSCRNYGFEISKGKYIQWLDDDDLLSENKLELQVNKLEALNNPKIFATCDWDLYWPDKKIELKNIFHTNPIVNSLNYFNELTIQQTFLPSHSYLVSRTLTLRTEPWNVSLVLNQDAEYFTRILINAEKLINTEGCYVLYRDHTVLRISRNRDIASIESYLLSLRLMHAYLKSHQINSKSYFKWKLFNIFYNNWKINKNVLINHNYFFKENGIDFRWSRYYMLKHFIYKIVYTWYKNNFKNKQH